MSPAQKQMYKWAMTKGTFFSADDAAEALNCTRNSASGRVRKLHKTGYMVVRKSKPSSGGQTRYFYKSIEKAVPVERSTFSVSQELIRYAQYGRAVQC